MDTALLLGAGASVEAGVPDSRSMTRKLVESLQAEHWLPLSQALNFVCGTLTAYDTAAGASPYDGLDVERVFAAVELLSERRTLEVTPFVASWHPAVDVWDRPTLPAFFDSALGDALMHPSGTRVRDSIVGLIESFTQGGTGETYELLADRMINELRVLTATTGRDLDYLLPIVRMGQRSGGLTVATLNYDLAVEQLAERERTPAETGIEYWTANRKWRWPDEGVRLLKLHGSINWCWAAMEQTVGHLPAFEVEVTDDPAEMLPPVLLFGQRGKLQADGPFLSMLAEFEALIERAQRLVVVGYSFRDEHINEVIRRWTRGSLERTIVIVDRYFPTTLRSDDFRRTLLDYLNPRPALSGEPARVPRVRIDRRAASAALSDVIG